ncbi:MAG TPA: SAM-dependent methyltransferase [Bacteroidia bacterium]|nr:SAM-dependent methyltransferase [Bacteroidia bacterium]HRS57764.1 SAM-dependent methyltransferase [Bacteroidia bacterium]HRU67295.1 SAM-dependent methyltransferase [Bacteroidia bacterium]
MSAILYLLPNLISQSIENSGIPEYNYQVIRKLKHFIVESRKPVNHLLKLAGVKTPFEGINFYEYNEHSNENEIEGIIIPLLKGEDMGLVSDAGYPAIADPGEKIILAVHHHHIRVVPLSGPSSILLALTASGLNAEQFVFHGYLPVKPHQRKLFLQKIENESFKSGYTQIFMDTPYRNQAVFKELIAILKPETWLCVAMELFGNTEKINTLPVKEWKKLSFQPEKKNVVFLLNAGKSSQSS